MIKPIFVLAILFSTNLWANKMPYSPDLVTKMPYSAALTKQADKTLKWLLNEQAAQDVVTTCLKDETIPEALKDVACSIYEPGCRTFSGSSKYSVEKRGTEMIVHLPMRYKYRGDETKKAEVLSNLEEGRLCTIAFYARYNIKMDLSFTEKLEGDYELSLYDDSPQTTYISWALIKDGGRTMPKSEICNTVIHELSHHLGLPDTYPVGNNCRKIRPKSNMMTNVYWETELLSLDEDQVAQIVNFVCGQNASCPGI